VIAIDGRLLERSVHPLDLAVGPGRVRLGKPVLDAMLAADVVEHMAVHKAVGPIRFCDRSANWMPLSVSTVWILWGTALMLLWAEFGYKGGASQLVCAARAKDVVKIVQTPLQRLMVRRRLVGPKAGCVLWEVQCV
jgi:hypothetical protein